MRLSKKARLATSLIKGALLFWLFLPRKLQQRNEGNTFKNSNRTGLLWWLRAMKWIAEVPRVWQTIHADIEYLQ